MNNVILQPASGAEPRGHYRDTVEKPISLSSIRAHLSSGDFELLEQAIAADETCVWGVRPSGVSKWHQMQAGDTVMFARDNEYFSISKVTWKTHSHSLAADLWGYHSLGGDTWEYVYFFGPPLAIEIPYTTINMVAEYKSNYVPQGINVLSTRKAKAVLELLKTILPGKAYIAKTHKDWASFLSEEGMIDSVNFWSPNPIPLRNDLTGNRLFFFAKKAPDDQRRVVGWGTGREFLVLSVEDAWSRFGLCNGANSLDEMIQRLNSFSSVSSEVGPTTVIGNTIVDDVIWLDEPMDIEEKGVHVAPQVVRGRSLTNEEEQDLLGVLSGPTHERTVIDRLNEEYRNSPPNRIRTVSSRIERSHVLVKLLKQLHPNECQLCGDTFFWKRGQQNRYSEVHHIRELSAGGMDAADNCLVLCANCHRKMHHGNVSIEDSGQHILVEEGNDPPKRLRKNVL